MSKQGYKTFEGGIHPPYQKELASNRPIQEAPVPAEVIIPLQQNIGAPNSPVVSAGDRVTVGQKIAETDAFVSAPVHSSVAGTVKAIEEITNFAGAQVKAAIIAADPTQPPFAKQQMKDVGELSAEEIRQVAREAGLVGMGGAAFPTHVKLTPPKDKPVDIVIINGCECEPFLTCDHRLMLERTGDLVEGLKLLMRAVGAERGIVGIEANKMDAVETVRAAIADDSSLAVEILECQVPGGLGEAADLRGYRQRGATGEATFRGGLPGSERGHGRRALRSGLHGKAALRARRSRSPGSRIQEPSNFLVKIGTPFSVLIEAAGGIEGTAAKLVMGGPMTGWAQKDATASVVKGTSGLVLLPPELVDVREEHECVRCTKCVDACPMFLMPNYIVEATKKGEWEKAELWGALDCFECGVCSFTCPAYIPHVQYVRKAKAEIGALKKR